MNITKQQLQCLLKTSQDRVRDEGISKLEDAGQQIVDYIKNNPEELGTLIGAAGGGALGGLTGDENRLMRALLGSMIGGTAGYGIGVNASSSDNTDKPEDPEAVVRQTGSDNTSNGIGDELGAIGATVGTHGAGRWASTAMTPATSIKDRLHSDEILRNYMSENLPDVGLEERPIEASGHYSPTRHTVSVQRNPNPGTLSHEIGHAENFNKYPKSLRHAKGKLTGLSKGTTMVSPLVPLFSNDKETARTGAMVGSAAAAPMLAEELSASRKGGQLLKKLTGSSKIGAFAGLPTYVAAAAAPGLIYKVKDWLGGIQRSEQICIGER